MSISTRRAALGAIFAAPLASVPAVALTGGIPSDVPDHEARFLALVPRLAAIVPPLERAKAFCQTLYADADREAGGHPGWDDKRAMSAWRDRAEQAQVRNGYRAAWKAWNRAACAVCDLVDPLIEQRMTTLLALAWKARVAAVLDCWDGQAEADLIALTREGGRCA